MICKVGDRFQVVEYSEISETTRNLRDKNGDLLYNAGNICNHFLSTDFLQELCTYGTDKRKFLPFGKFFLIFFLKFKVNMNQS